MRKQLIIVPSGNSIHRLGKRKLRIPLLKKLFELNFDFLIHKWLGIALLFTALAANYDSRGFKRFPVPLFEPLENQVLVFFHQMDVVWVARDSATWQLFKIRT